MRPVLFLALVSLLLQNPCRAQELTLKRIVTPAAAGMSSAQSTHLHATAGQPVAGFASATGVAHWIGFWVPSTSGQDPLFPGGIAQAKLQPDGTRVALTGAVAASGPLQPGGFLYIGRADRASGIRVQPLTDTIGISPGAVLSVTGTMDTTAEGERQVAGALLSIDGAATPLVPPGMALKSAGGSDLGGPGAGQSGVTGGVGLNNIGLLARAWGSVTGTDGGGLALDDASGVLLRLDLRNAPGPFPPGGRLEVTGMVSLTRDGPDLLPLLIPRSPEDIRDLD